VSVRNDGTLAGSPFPSNRYTVFRRHQNTLRRVHVAQARLRGARQRLPGHRRDQPLDGFSIQPRITVPFTGDIDPSTVNSDTSILVNLGDTLTLHGFGERVGVNQVLWDPATQTARPRERSVAAATLALPARDHRRVRDTKGKKIKSDGWGDDFGLAFGRDPRRRGLSARPARRRAVDSRQSTIKVVAASLFSTQSTAPTWPRSIGRSSIRPGVRSIS
jgi:hypothetical protein